MNILPNTADPRDLVDYVEDTLQMHAAAVFTRACKKTVWFHVPNGGKRSKATAARLRKMGVRRGVADFILLCRGLAIAVELKTRKKGRQSDDQEGFEIRWTENGGVYVLVRTPSQIEGLIFRFGLD
jgi:hypothetical protein